MTGFSRGRFWFATLMIAGCGVAAIMADITVKAATNGVTASQEFSLPAQPPKLPEQKSPVALFRELLAMSPDEQKEYLADRSPDHQRRILAKLHEYEALRPNQRELKLRVTELQWYLSPLLELPLTNRAARLLQIPDDQRKLVADRLRDWDKLPADAKKELLDNEATLRYFTQVDPVTEEQKQAVLGDLSPWRRNRLEAGITRWQQLPLEQREQTLQRFNQFFDLTAAEQQRSLATLSDEERRQMEKTLKRYEQLTGEQRQDCIQAFAEFAAMSLEERQQFLKNAERWQVMSPDERQSWRELVQKLAARGPLPPGAGRSLFPRPPMPPPPLEVPTSTVATNDRK